MVYRLQVTCEEIIYILDVTYIAGSTIGYTLLPGVQKISVCKMMFKSLLPGKANFLQLLTLD